VLPRRTFEALADRSGWPVHRAKGLVRLEDGSDLFNYANHVSGRVDLEPFDMDRTEIAFIGKDVRAKEDEIRAPLGGR
jgi:G3E family GTPase